MKAIVIGGTYTGVGKTSIAVGIMAALRRRGLRIQPFKVGPDFVDPMHHQLAAGRESYNLDGWLLDRDANLRCFTRHARGADVAVIEGVMGLFDGRDGKTETGSTAEMAKMLNVPVVLVLDCWVLARSAAAMVHGYVSFDPALNFAGVILNKVAGAAHTSWLKEALESTHVRVPVLGGIPKSDDLSLPERHLGLHMPSDTDNPRPFIDHLADVIEQHLDLDELLRVAGDFPSMGGEGGGLSAADLDGMRMVGDGMMAELPPLGMPPGARVARIGVARDKSFCFYYKENLTLLREAGAELVFFSPLEDELPHRLDGIYLGGGYPELSAAQLSSNKAMMFALRAFAAAGGVMYGECGGLMYLSESIETSDGAVHEMCGVLPFRTRMVTALKMAYCKVFPQPSCRLFPSSDVGEMRGQLFHYSEAVLDDETFGPQMKSLSYIIERQMPNSTPQPEGYSAGNVLASYVHLHFGSNPAAAYTFVDQCRADPSKVAAVAAASTTAVSSAGALAAAAAAAADTAAAASGTAGTATGAAALSI